MLAPAVRDSRPSRAVVAPPYRGYWFALALGVLAAAALILASQLSVHRDTTRAASRQPAGVAESRALLAGIPQHGNVLGSPHAPVRLIEYADPQCPYCALSSRYVLPELIREYVRPGRVQLVYRGLGFIGPDSQIALRTAIAAGAESRLWNVMDLIYRNQGPENAWVTDEVLRGIVTAAGANANKVMAARDDRAVTARMDAWATLASTSGVNGVPAFFVGRRGSGLSRIPLRQIDIAEFRGPLNGALQR